MFGLTFAHLSLRPNFPLSGSLSFPLSRKFGLRPDRKNDFTFWINFRSAESLVSAKDERKSEPKVKVTHCVTEEVYKNNYYCSLTTTLFTVRCHVYRIPEVSYIDSNVEH